MGGIDNQATGFAAFVGGGSQNRARGAYSVVSGGGNLVDSDSNSALGFWSTIAGGKGNVTTGSSASIGGGVFNKVTEDFSTVGGGNTNNVSGRLAVIGGGEVNEVTSRWGTVGGGRVNLCTGEGATIGGGRNNEATGNYSTVAGGGGTSADLGNFATGEFSMIPGGHNNEATGRYSMAAGRSAKSNHNGCFVWADTTNADFTSTGINQFLIRASGGVGIGTAGPEGPFHIFDGSAGATTANSNAVAVFETSYGGWLNMIAPDNSERGLLFSEPGNPVAGAIVFDQGGGGNDLGFRTGGNVTNMTLDASGNLTVVGCVDGNNTACASDQRFKRNIATVSGPVDLISRLRGVTYEWRAGEFPDRHFESGKQYGVVAQEVREVIPEIVREREDGYLSVKYTSLVPILLEAIKEQQRIIEKQNERLANLEKKLEQ